MKRIRILFLAVLLLLPICACAEPNTGDDAKSEASLGGKTFVWEKDGFGGDFTIMLNEDGTYEYSAGFLSSYIGYGNWSVENGMLTMTEDQKRYGYDNVFRFSVGSDELIFVSEGSSTFLYVTVEDGDRFLLYRPAEPDLQKPAPTLVIEANGTVFYAALEDNSSAKALIEKLNFAPVTVNMHDYGSFEKVGSLPWELPRNDEQITTVPGDVILYQGNQITIYYDENTWNFTRLATIGNVTREKLLEALGDGDVSVTLHLEWSE